MQFFAVIYFLLGLTSLTIATPIALISENDRSLATRTALQLTPSIAAELEAMSATLASNNSSTTNGPTLKERNKAEIYCASQIGSYNWPWAEVDAIRGLVPTLQGCRCFAKARDYAIIASNDFDISSECAYLGSYALDIIDYYNGQLNLGKFLNGPDSFRKAWFVLGQKMDTDGYNVVVRGFGANPS
ncbi:hypothetical protein HYALB_00010208 [Hymenoscyphus albidus]|uniref:Ecp2 effector protein domain-containing protein n=1 Tax=Hymenoscyphus albidus TaxID=595503 RepID=A0A9N9LS62_9HELO|nr:hypothetical protein HYALB_00010208 [Hymenoscyphus albidus]